MTNMTTKTATKEKKSPLKVILSDGSNLNLVVDKTHHLYNPRAEGPPVDPTLPARIEQTPSHPVPAPRP